MANIIYSFLKSASLKGTAPAPEPNGEFSNAILPAEMDMPGMYMILNMSAANADHYNRYIGIAENIKSRFNTRMATVTELGFDADQMDKIWVCWGNVSVQDDGAHNATLIVPKAKQPLVTKVEGVDVNLEQLLIRFALTKLGAAGTVSNNVYAKKGYKNPCAKKNTVTFKWAALSNIYKADEKVAVWNVGEEW